MPGPTNFNIAVTPPPVASVGGASPAGKAPQAAPAVQSRTREIAPPTTYNTDSGLLEPVKGGWTGKDVEARPAAIAKPDPKPGADGKPAPTRHEQWKTAQAKAKADREAKGSEKVAKSQALARDFLKSGDLAGAAKALGMSPADFREYAQNVLLTVPTPDKELTPEQKREADEEKLRADLKAIKDENDAFRAQTVRSTYIKDKIAPALADAEKFQFIHDQGLDKISAYIYDLMNLHYGKTREELNPADVAAEVERQLEANFMSSIERARKIKRVAKLFRDTEADPAALDEPIVPSEVDEEQIRQDTRFPERRLAGLRAEPLAGRYPAREEMPDEEPEPARPRQAVIRSEPSGAGVPFALLSREEKLARIDAENRAARRA